MFHCYGTMFNSANQWIIFLHSLRMKMLCLVVTIPRTWILLSTTPSSHVSTKRIRIAKCHSTITYNILINQKTQSVNDRSQKSQTILFKHIRYSLIIKKFLSQCRCSRPVFHFIGNHIVWLWHRSLSAYLWPLAF